MAPKSTRVVVERADRRRPAPKGYFGQTYEALTAPENASVVRSVAIFGVSLTLILSDKLLTFLTGCCRFLLE
jgi:hypothetical protein